VQIGIIQEEAQKLKAENDIQVIEADIVTLERAIAELKSTLAAIPHARP
jgi:hypothetical protein